MTTAVARVCGDPTMTATRTATCCSRRNALLLALALAASAAGAFAQGPAQLGEREKTFLDQVAARDLAEIELSKLIRVKSASRAVRRLARTILADDTANYERLFQLCLRREYAIAPQLDERHRQLLAQVRSARSGTALGRKYVDTLLVDQASLETLLVELATHAPAGDIEQFASDTAQMNARHEQMARALASK